MTENYVLVRSLKTRVSAQNRGLVAHAPSVVELWLVLALGREDVNAIEFIHIRYLAPGESPISSHVNYYRGSWLAT